MKAINQEAICDKHSITYTQTVIRTAEGKEVSKSPCPACAAEMLDNPRQEDVIERNEIAKQNHKRKTAGIFMDSGIPPRYTTRSVDNFHAVTSSQQKALGSVTGYISNIKAVCEHGTSMIMTGGVGTGKTHLASAIGNAFIGLNKSVAFMTVSAMFRKIRETYRQDSTKTEQQVIGDLRNVDLLVLDEIGVQKGSESEEHLLFEVLNERYCHFKPTILISNLTAKEITDYIGVRALDRLKEGGGKLVVFDWESHRSQVLNDDTLPSKSGAKYEVTA